MEALDRAIDAAGGVGLLAAALGVTQAAVSNWKQRGVPPKQCRAIEEATAGVVKRHELRPDIFDPPVPANGKAA